jgi:hypothetical protein
MKEGRKDRRKEGRKITRQIQRKCVFIHGKILLN